MKIGVIGLGGIAQKAYLPLYSQMQDQAEFYLCSRDPQKAQTLAQRYGLSAVADMQELKAVGITGCFVHTATATHYTIVKELLEAGIAVYVDKPLSERLEEVEELERLAQAKGVLLQVGFNRRFAPLVEKLHQVPDKHVLVLQKNRVSATQTPAFAIYDLFIHVVDTLLYLLDDPLIKVDSTIVEEAGVLQRVILQAHTATTTGIASMDMQAGANRESYEVTSSGGSYLLENLTDLHFYSPQGVQTTQLGDWTPTLTARGFEPAVQHFLTSLQNGSNTVAVHALSHELCQQILRKHQRLTM
ncbi:gfo/Idh/MocA family oxidoreductase [Enterococcus canis]|uniref:Gfo/Idh/MocA family oxidoreductase n=1 Tax=Enterococcus canis TaxID=214095 RepID=A0A1L8RFW9_9ENTE|nr:Gfo/Idh/MocA family oxidoreductase [Enterococcus canis]OJG18623.1 gfo/Idh/MocA family oxidoreductase [Enterococcus canis]